MRKRKVSTRAGAWVLSAAMLINGMPLNVFAESAEDGIYTESVEDTGDTDAIDSGDGVSSVQENWESEDAGEDNSAAEQGADNETSDNTGENTEIVGEAVPGNSEGASTEAAAGNDTSGSIDNSTADDFTGDNAGSSDSANTDVSDSGDNSDFVDSEGNNQEEIEDSNEDTSDDITTHDAIFQILWSDENNLADRRDDQDLSRRFIIYQNGQPMESQPQILLDKEMEDGAGGTRLGTYRVQSLPDSDGSGTDYTYSIKENVPAGYEAFTADAVTGLDDETTASLLTQLIAPDQELPVTLAEGDGLYRADKMFGNYLRQYTCEGKITWNDNANQQNIRPDLEFWFQNHIQITLDGAAYKSFRVHYEQNADDESVWNYQIKGLFAVKEDKTQATYEISLNVPEGYATESGTFTVNGNQKDCQTTFGLVQNSEDNTDELETEPTEAPEENAETESTEAAEAEEFSALDPEDALIVLDAEGENQNSGTAELVAAFLDKSAEGKDYPQLLSNYGVYLSYQTPNGATVPIKLVYSENVWKADSDSEAALTAVGLTSADLATKITSSWTLGTGSLSLAELPSATKTGESITWSLGLAEDNTENRPGYCAPVKSEDSNTYKFVPYYKNAAENAFSITIDLREGGKQLQDTDIEKLLRKLTLSYTNIDGVSNGTISLADLLNKKGNSLFENAYIDESCYTYDAESNKITLTIPNLPWCTTDKNEFVYSITSGEIAHEEDGISSIPSGDKLVPRYDNAGSSNYGSITDRCHDNGILYLTLTGDTEYSATKIWLDENPGGQSDGRPTPTWKLWRYPKKDGVDFTKASPVLNESGEQIKWNVDNTVAANKEVSYGVVGTAQSGITAANNYDKTFLPKYDSDGYEYIYFIRENNSGGTESYEQIYGKISTDADGNIVVDENGKEQIVSTGYLPSAERAKGDSSVYNGNTLSNRITGSTSTSVRKVWKNAAHQDNIQDVTVTLTLQSTTTDPNAADPSEEIIWTNVKDVQMNGFKSEIQELQTSESVPKYDALGRKLYYRWIESNVTEKKDENSTDTAEDIVKGEDGAVKQFTLDCNRTDENTRNEKEWYSSESSINEETGETVITNSLTGETQYFVDKIWEGWEGLTDNKTAPAAYADKTIKVILFQGTHPLRDENGKVKEFEISANTSTYGRKWSLLIDKLPKYSAEGYKLTYYAVEQNANDGTFSASFKYNLDELKDDYSVNNAQITNSPGNGTKFIRLEKEWKDDGDTYYRYPVQVGVWRTRDNKYLGKETLSEANNWWSYFAIKAEDYQDGDTYYIREIGMGVKEDGNVIYPTYTTSTNTVSNGKTPEKQENTLSDLAVTGTGDNLTAAGGATPLNVVTDYVDTGDSEYRYDVTYSVIKGTGNKNTNNTAGEGETEENTTNDEESVFPMDTYRVTNHRYGWINLKVTKKWVDGSRSSGERLALGAKLKVEIANPVSDKIGAEITENGVVANGITYPIYGNAELTQTAQSLKAIGNTADGENTETVYFYNLPKFDSKGAKIRYKVVEYAPGKDAEGNIASLDVTTAKTTLSDADYGTSVEDGKYVVVDNVRHALDTQEITVTNRRSATKDIYFYKLWIDQAVKDKRPDIFMVLYQSVNSAAPTKYGEFKPYEVSQTADGAYIKYEFQNLPKYDGNGAEITYYALEAMHADGSALDYIPVQYYYSDQADTVAGNKVSEITDLKQKYLTDIGAECYAAIGYENDKYTVTNSPKSDDSNVLTAEDGEAVLKESGTFVNEIRNTVEIDGKKVWANVLADFPKNNLPAINFVLLQKLKGSEANGNEVATFDDWLSTDANKTEFSFAMKYVGLNDKTGAYKGVWTKNGTEGSVTVGESVSAENQWTQLLPKYDKNGNLYEYTLEEKYKENTDFAGLYKVSGLNTYQVNNTFKAGTRSITVKKEWDDTDKSVAGKRPDVTFELYRFFGIEDENGKETYTSPKKVATQILKNGESTVTFSNLHVYAPDKSICYYYVKEVVPNGYENPAGVKNPTGIEMNYTGTGIIEVSNVTITEKDASTTSSIFRFTDDATASQPTEGSTSNSAAVTFTNKYKDTQTETTTIKGQKIWNDQSNAFGTRPNSIKITLKRYAVNNSAGNNNAYGAENVFGKADEKIVLKLPTVENQNEIVSKYVKTASSGSPTNEIVKSEMVNTSADGITVTVKKNADTNIWDYEISGLDKYAPNGGEWIYTIEEETVAITDSNGTKIGHYTSYVGTSESNTISSAQGTKGEGNTVIMPSLTNKLNTTSANVTKIWQNQQLVISRLMEIKVELWVKIGEGNTATYQKASEVSEFKSRTAADGTPYNVVLEGNSNSNKNSNTWNYTFNDLPTAIKDADGNYQKCSYMVVESAIRYSNETWLELNPSYSNGEISYNPSSNKYTITYNYTDATASAVAKTVITNTLTDTKSISFEKQWAGDSGNKYNTRPSTIRIFLQQKISGDADSTYVTIAKWNMSLDSARDKLSNASGSSANGTWSVVDGKATISDLPKYTLTSGTAQEYAYRVIEVGDDTGELTVGGQDESSNDIVASAKNPASNKKAGVYYEVTSTTDENGHTTITNTLPTTSLRVEKTWLNDAGISDTVLKSVYENLKLTLKRYKLDEDGSGQKSDNEIVAGEENVSPVWKKDTTTGNWYAEYTNLPKYYGAYKDSKGTVHGLKYVYYVTEATQPGYLNPEITDPNSSNSYSKAELTNKAIVFHLDKTDGTTSIRNRALTLLLTGIEETGTAGYTAKWSKDAAGKELVVVKNGDTEIYSKTAADSTSHVDIKGLPLGEYTLTETRVPDGYEQLASAKITLSSVNTSDSNTEQKLSIKVENNSQVQVKTTDTNGTILTVPMITVANTKTSLNVIKTDGTQKLSGAEFILKPAEGSHFASRDTDKETNGLTFTVNENGIVNNPTNCELIIGNTYILTETKAPDGYIRLDTSTGDKPTVTFTLDANGNIILSGETNGYTITGFASSDVSITANNSESFTIVNHPIEIGLQKISSREDTVKLSGAKFTVTDNTVKATSSEETSYKKEVLTDSNGQLKLTGTDATVKLIQNHSYTLEEIQAPEGYILPDTHPTISFTVDENGTIKNVETSPVGYITVSTTGKTANKLIEVKNDPIEFSLEKQDIVKNADQSVRYLPDTVFELYKGDKADQNAVYDTVPLKTLKTDANGKLTFATSAGNGGYVLTTGVRYKLVETGAPVGYEKASPFTFVINENGTITYETDSASGNNGAETLYDEATKTFIVKDTKTSFELDKINSEKKSAINDVDLVLTVKDKVGNTVLTWRRNSEGNVSVEASNSYANTIEYRNGKIHGLPVSVTGTDTEYYVLSETGTPKGYATAASVQFTMGVDGKLSYYDNNADVKNNNKLELITNETNESKLTIFDQPIRGHVTITKTLDGTNKKLQGVTFDLYKKKGTGTSAAGATSANEDILIASGLTTDENGQWTTKNNSTYFAETAGEGSSVPLSKGLPSGTYYFVETSTTDNAVLVSGPVGEFTVTDTSATAIVTVDPVSITNAEFKTSLKLKKLDSTTNTAIIKGVTFKLEKYTLENNNVDSTKIDETTVDANGEIVFDNLQKGKYILTETSATGYDGGFTAYFEIGDKDNGKPIEVNQANANRFFSDAALSTPIASSWLSESGIYNTRKKAALTVYKVGLESPDSVGGIGLNNVEFSLYKKAENAAQADDYTEILKGLKTGNVYKYEAKSTAYTPSSVETNVGTLKITDLEWGDYKLVETKSADGYSITGADAEFTIDQETDFDNGVKLKVNNNNQILNYQTKLRVKKQGTDGIGLAGAVFEISGVFAGKTENDTRKAVTNANGELVLDGNENAGVTGLLVGGNTYTLKEITPPDGYELLTDTITFVMNADGTIAKVVNEDEVEETWPESYVLTTANSFDNLITVTDNKIQIRLEKYSDDDPAKKLNGAEFKVTPVNDKTFADGKTQTITLTDANMSTGLDGMVIAGHSYKVTEIKAPDGYKLAADFIFAVGVDGSVEVTNPIPHGFVTTNDENGVAVIKVIDSKNQLVIRKTNENSKSLSADVMKQVQLTITDITNVSEENAGTVVMNLTSQPSAHDPYTYDSENASWTIQGQLIQGHTYRLDETKVPDNYLIAVPVVFTMGMNGEITINSGAVPESQAGQVSEEDERANNLYLAGTQNNSLTIRDTKVKGSVTITKQDSATNKKLENVEFEFYRQNADSKSELIQNDTVNPASSIWTTGADGTLTINGLSVGNYYFKEVKADGYAYDTDKVYRVSISKSAANEQVKVTYGEGFEANSSGEIQPVIENSKTILTINKVDGSGEKLNPEYMAQVKLTLTDQTDSRTLILGVPKDSSNDDVNETNYVTYNESDESWTITGWLIQGHAYTLKETQTPYEYRTAPEITFAMGEMGVITGVKNAYESTSKTLTVSDKKLVGKITLTKTLEVKTSEDESTVSALEGVVFDLYRRTPEGTSVYKENLRTNVSGQIVVEDLPEGTYYFIEKEAPDNVYMDAGKTAEVTIDESSTDEENLVKAVSKSDVPFETKVELVKVEENEGNAVIPGTEFTLSKLDSTGKPISGSIRTDVTGADGKVTFVINEAGTYQIKETKPAYGYENSNYEKTFTVTNTAEFQGETTDFGKVENKRQTGSVTVIKKDNTDPANVIGINGITFKLYKVNGGEDTKLGTFQTGNIYTRDTEAESGWSAAKADEDQLGFLKISDLEWGSYYLKETEADVYQVDSTKRYEFVIGNTKNDEEKSGIDVTLDDILNVQNQLTITKIDEDGKPLGSVLDQETLSNLELTVKEVLTDKDGKIEEKDVVVLKPAASENGEYSYDPATTTWTLTGKLTQGHTYKLVETGRPEGYVTAQPITFIMGQDGKIQIQSGSAEKAAGDEILAGTTNLYTDTALAVRDIKLHADICLEKTGENGAKVQGAVFSLYKRLGENADPKSDKLIAEGLETGEDGKTAVQTVEEGFYYFVETAAPADKVLDSTPTTPVQVSEGRHDTVITVSAVNKDFHYSVEISKKDGTDENLLDGVEFTLYEVAENDNLVKVASGTTGSENNETGKLTFNITKAGTYEIQETGTIYGYEFNKENPYKYRFTISNTDEYQNARLSLEVKNTRSTGTVTLTKKDGETEEALNDIIFTLYYKAPGAEEYKKVLDTVTGKTYTGKTTESETVWEENAGKDGEITVDSLPWGDYYMVETKADGYVLKDSEYHFTIGKVQSLTSGLEVNLTAKYGEITNDPNQILIAKQDAEGNLIGGAELQLIGPKNYKETWTSTRNGAHLLKRLPEGDYTLTETKAPAGYIRSTEEIHFTVAAGGKILDANGEEIKVTEETPIAITMTNTRNSLTITKIDEVGNPLGSVLDQETLSNLELTVREVLTDENGETEEKDVVVLKPAASENGEYSYDPTTTTWTLTGKLTQGHTYKLVETGRPEGYMTAQPITFIMGQNGKIQIQGDSAEKAAGVETSAGTASGNENSAENSEKTTSTEKTAESLNQNGTTNLYTDTALAVRDIKLHADICLEKKDENGAKVQGAVFSLYKLLGENADPKSDKLIAEGLETGEDGKTAVQTVEEGFYYFVETSAPADKVLDSTPTTPVQVSEGQHGTGVTVSAVNKDFHYSVEITKKDGTDETLLDGVEFTLYKVVDDETLVKVASGTTGSENNETGKLTFNITKAGTYEIQETGTIYGYEFDKDNPYKHRFTISNTDEYQNAKLSLEVKNTRSTGTVTLTKKDGETEETLNDIIFALYYKAPGTEEYKKVLDTVTGKNYTGKTTESETVWEENAGKDGEITVDSLPWGDYYMVETKADSYVLSDTKYEFTIGNVQDEKAHSGLFVDLGTIYNEKIRGSLLLKKKDGQGNPLENAVFTLYKMKGDTANTSADEKIQENFTTDKNGEIRVENLPEGKYYFVETAAPDNVFMDGRSSDVAVLDQSVHSKTIEVDMVNTDFQAGVELVKTDADTGAALSGVEFTLYRKEGEAYTEVSRQGTDANGKSAFTLSQAGSYKVVETIGAYGYDYNAENPYTAEFTVTNTADFQNTVLTLADSVSEAVAKKYDVKISGNLSQNTGSVTNRKTPAEETGSITVTKYLQLDGMTNGLELGAADSTFYTALFTDAEGTRRYSDVKALHIQNGTSTSVTFDDLPKGTYYVFETLEDGTRIPYEELTADANGNLYYCTGVGTENIAISPQQKEASAELYNWYMDLPDGYYMSGRLEITKNVIKNGETAETDDTFYAGVFDESGNLVTVAELLQNGTVTVDVRLGGADYTQPITYTVEETDKDGNALDESFPYDIEVSGSGYISRENPIGSITITNTVIEEEPEPTETPAPTETPTPEPTEIPDNGGSDGSSGGHGSSNVKTGDDTNAQPFVLLFLLSGTVLIYIGRKRRKSA